MHPVVFFDGLRVKIHEDGVVRNKAVYLTLGVLPDGTRDILGLWRLALRNITSDWKRASKEWKSAMNQLAILYGDRFTLAPR